MTDETGGEGPAGGGGASPARRVVVQRLDGFDAVLREVADGSFVLEGPDGEPLPELAPGERLRVTEAVPGDATYARSARVLRVDEDAQQVRVSATDHRMRRQQRRFVRVRTEPLDIVLARPEDDQLDSEVGTTGPTSYRAAELRDLSAGGVRIALDEGPALQVGDVVDLQLRLPRPDQSPLEIDLVGEAVWCGTLADGRHTAGVEFAHTDDRTEAKLAQWVFQVQARRR